MGQTREFDPMNMTSVTRYGKQRKRNLIKKIIRRNKHQSLEHSNFEQSNMFPNGINPGKPGYEITTIKRRRNGSQTISKQQRDSISLMKNVNESLDVTNSQRMLIAMHGNTKHIIRNHQSPPRSLN